MPGQRSMMDRFWEGYKDMLIGFTILMIALLPLFLVSMITDSPEVLSAAGFVVVPILLWWILSRRHPQREP